MKILKSEEIIHRIHIDHNIMHVICKGGGYLPRGGAKGAVPPP